MTLVMLGCLPVMAVVRILLDRVEVRMAARADESYSRASGIAQQVLSQIRTVVSYGAEERELAQYAQLLVDPAKVHAVQGMLCTCVVLNKSRATAGRSFLCVPGTGLLHRLSEAGGQA